VKSKLDAFDGTGDVVEVEIAQIPDARVDDVND
jgi:hypothetical protein